MKFGFDIDDTLINLREHAFHLYGRRLGREVAIERFRECATISIHELFGLSAEEGRRLWQEMRDEIYYTSCLAFPGAVEALNELARRGHEVYYVTARTPEHCERTRDWLAAAGFPVADGRFYCGMGDGEKIHVIRELGLDYYFDDKPAVLDTLSGLDLQVYAKDNAYNRHLDFPRIGSWDELLALLKE